MQASEGNWCYNKGSMQEVINIHMTKKRMQERKLNLQTILLKINQLTFNAVTVNKYSSFSSTLVEQQITSQSATSTLTYHSPFAFNNNSQRNYGQNNYNSSAVEDQRL
ncbi:hypothetical protein DEO72_LG8g1746 [Vigna unguiculata]|uniref:Uncharacterized protein n=1 Tax=Vigna unguiculata TaxID=3917 RepID=A0A4D6MSW0_VIGUN|nr:hypothetical protein DEO72_LG8g1746 [Vigna unguiculata]